MNIYIGTPFRYKSNPHLIGFNEIDKKSREINLLRGIVNELDVDVSRNILVQDFINKTNDDSWLLFIDDDVLLPTDTLDLFLKDLQNNPDTKVFYGNYALKKRSYESAHCYKNNEVVTIATGLTFIHKEVFTHLKENNITNYDVNDKDYRWFICDQNKPNTGEDHYFTSLLKKANIPSKLIEDLEGIHIDFSKKAAFGKSSLVRNGKIRYDKAYIYAIDKASPLYFDIVEHEIEVTEKFFPKTKKNGKISVLTPKRLPSTPIMSRLYLDDMRGKYHIDMLSVHSMPRDKARNTLVQSALDDGADYIVFLDDDNIVPFDFIQQLIDTNEPIVGLNYGFKKPYYESVHLMNEHNHSIPKDATGLIDVTRCFAIGACLIKREVFDNIGYPWFQEWTDDNQETTHQEFNDGSALSYTDDSFFTNRAVKEGYTPKVLSDVHAGHIDFSSFKVYGHPDIVDDNKLINNNKWALSDNNLKEIVKEKVYEKNMRNWWSRLCRK